MDHENKIAEDGLKIGITDNKKAKGTIIEEDTYIYPEYGGRGRLENTIVARKLPYKIHKLTGYEVEVSPRLWDNKLEGVHSWTMHGLRFGAYSSKARAVLAK